MIVLEFKTYGKKQQFMGIDEAIRTAQFEGWVPQIPKRLSLC